MSSNSFSNIGKASFLHRRFTRISIIEPGSEGFVAFIHLIGVVYFVKKAFQDYSPENLYHSLAESNKETSDQHQDWYNTIIGKTWEQIQFEHKLPPSIDRVSLAPYNLGN